MEMMIAIYSLIVLVFLSFFAGVRFADRYADRRERAVAYALKKQYARLRAGMDADDAPLPYTLPDAWMD